LDEVHLRTDDEFILPNFNRKLEMEFGQARSIEHLRSRPTSVDAQGLLWVALIRSDQRRLPARSRHWRKFIEKTMRTTNGGIARFPQQTDRCELGI
jgi:hypothetical protein